MTSGAVIGIATLLTVLAVIAGVFWAEAHRPGPAGPDECKPSDEVCITWDDVRGSEWHANAG